MIESKLIRNQRFSIGSGRFVVDIKVFEVPVNKKFPDGVKLKCILIDVEQGRPRLLLDNHEPFGFHLHTRLPTDHDFRVSLDIQNFEEAIHVFFGEVRKVLNDEN